MWVSSTCFSVVPRPLFSCSAYNTQKAEWGAGNKDNSAFVFIQMTVLPCTTGRFLGNICDEGLRLTNGNISMSHPLSSGCWQKHSPRNLCYWMQWTLQGWSYFPCLNRLSSTIRNRMMSMEFLSLIYIRLTIDAPVTFNIYMVLIPSALPARSTLFNFSLQTSTSGFETTTSPAQCCNQFNPKVSLHVYLFRWLYAHVAVRNNQCNMWMWYLHCTHAVCMWLLTYWYMIMSVVIVALLWEKMLPLRMPWLEFSVGALVYYPLYALCTAVEYKYITWLFSFAGWISVSSSGQIVAKWLQLAVCE